MGAYPQHYDTKYTYLLVNVSEHHYGYIKQSLFILGDSVLSIHAELAVPIQQRGQVVQHTNTNVGLWY